MVHIPAVLALGSAAALAQLLRVRLQAFGRVREEVDHLRGLHQGAGDVSPPKSGI